MNALWESFRRSWIHSTGMQIATLASLTAAYGVTVFVLTLSLNLKRVLSTWGESVQVTAYLKESADDATVAAVRTSMEAMPEAAAVDYVPKEKATELFRAQMASYAPDLLSDKDFAHPFPASFHFRIKADSAASLQSDVLDSLASTIRNIAGVEDVSYGQSWVKNYSGVVKVASASGWALALLLAAGGLFVVGNSIRASVANRRDEIEILELVGATPAMVRAPYIFEGAAMGLGAATLAIVGNFAIWQWEQALVRKSFSLTRLIDGLAFLSPLWIAGLLIGAAMLGAIGAFLIVRSINDGWAASQGAAA